MKWFSVLAIYLLCANGVVSGGTFYLDANNGADSNPGTSTAPWKTLNKAKTALKAGDTVLMRNGNYGIVSFTTGTFRGTGWDAPITFKAAPGANPTLSGISFNFNARFYLVFDGMNITPGSAFLNGSSIKILNSTFKGPTDYYGIQIKVDGYAVGDILVENCDLSYYKRNCSIQGSINQPITFRNCHMHHTTNSCFHLLQTKGSALITIDGCHIHTQVPLPGAHSSCVALRGDNVTIRNCIMHNFGYSSGLMLYGSHGLPQYDNIVVENNLFYDMINYPVVFNDKLGKNCKFNNNTVVGDHRKATTGKYKYYVMTMMGGVAGSTLEMYNNVVVGIMGVDIATFSSFKGGNNICWDGPQGYNNIVAINIDENYFEGSGNFFKGGAAFDKYSYTRVPSGGNYPGPHGQNLNDAYQLAAGSPAIGFANPGFGPTVDQYGVDRDPSPDAGAFEYTTTGLHPEIPNPKTQIPIFHGQQGMYDLTGKQVSENSRKTGLYLVREANSLKKVMVIE